MKVILTRDVPKLGDMGTIQDVKSGYARNYLIPQGLAVIATPGMVKQVEERQAAEERRIAALEEEMRELSERIEGMHIEIHARVGEQGRLFGSITSADIAEKLSEAVGQEIDRRTVELEAPIREVGQFEVPVRLVGRLVPKVNVEVYDPDQPLTRAGAAEEAEESDEAEEIAELEPTGEADVVEEPEAEAETAEVEAADETEEESA